MRTGLCLAVLIAFSGTARAQDVASQPEPILETGELMLMVIKPAYDELQRAMAAPPADRQQWSLLYQKAARLAEFENLILFRPHERSNTPEWKTLATNARKATGGAGKHRRFECYFSLGAAYAQETRTELKRADPHRHEHGNSPAWLAYHTIFTSMIWSTMTP